MNYLEASEYAAYGLEETTAESWVTAASALMDAHCRRATLGVQQYTERMRVDGRGVVRLTYLPLAAVAPATSAIVALRGRMGVLRRGEANEDLLSEVAREFGLAGAWSTMDVSNVDYDPATGELTLPAHALGLPYNEVEVAYTAGLDPMPEAVKCACAQIVRNAQATPAMNVRMNYLDGMRMGYFSDSLLDEDARKMLAPYVAQRVG